MTQPREAPAPGDGRRSPPDPRVPRAAAILGLAVFAAYANTFGVPMLLDDHVAISEAFASQHRGWWETALFPPENAGTGGRPVLNLTFALNHAWTGEAVWSYHLVNLAIHAVAALVFFGLVRRTLLLPVFAGRWSATATGAGFAAAAVWALHPIQTEAVTYLSQRAESLAGLFYLLTLYGFVRSTDTAHPGRWRIGSIIACWCGMATKEVVVTAPVAVFLYDWAFVGGSLRAGAVQRWRFHAKLGASWILLGVLMTSTHLGVRGVGFEQGVRWFDYARAEAKVVVLYAKLAAWPHPLVFDYGPEWMTHDTAVIWPYAVALAGGLAATLWLGSKSRRLGFAAAGFFLLLAPTSSVVPIAAQPMAENRMYLPLGALVGLIVPIACQGLGRRALPGFAALAVVLGVLTVSRNHAYRSAVSIWEDTLAKHPFSSRAHNNLAVDLAKVAGREPEALAQYEQALRIKPDFAEAHVNLGAELAKTASYAAQALAHFEQAIRFNPRSANAHYNLALALAPHPERRADALAHYEEALRLKPGYAEAHNSLAVLLAQVPGRMPEALAHYQAALRLRPDFAEAHNNYGNDLAKLPGRQDEALAEYQAALNSQPDFVPAHVNLANELAKLPGRQAEALAHYEAALRFEPDNADVHLAYAKTLMGLGHTAAAIAQCEAALRRNPPPDGARKALADALALAGKFPAAVVAYQEILQTQRSDPEIFYNLGVVHQQMGKPDEAASDYENALALNPRHWGALNNLGVICGDKGERDRAAKYFEQALAINPALESARSRLQQYREGK